MLEAILIENLFYIITVIETLFVAFYIVNEIVKEKLLALNLRQENLKLRTKILYTNFNVQTYNLFQNRVPGRVHLTYVPSSRGLRGGRLAAWLDG